MQIKELFTTKSDGNIAYHVTKNYTQVENSITFIEKKYGINLKHMHRMEQTHGNEVQIVTKDSPKVIKNCDAIITNEPNRPLMVMVADCIPILLKDQKKGVIAAVHAGRNSTFLKITSKTVQLMQSHFGCKPCDIEATLGPSIQQCCYEVDLKLAHIVQTSFSKEFESNRYIDLQGINTMQLQQLGVKNIYQIPICTKCSKQDYFSYRLDKSCGRFAGIISLES
jgi:YfiH family protein